MVFATTASAFMHLNEHLHTDLTSLHDNGDSGHHHGSETGHEAEHAHHFNLHVVGDLVEHEHFSFIKSANLISQDVVTPLITRTYSPPIPPPNT